MVEGGKRGLFEDLKTMWRTELHWVEEVMDACLKSLDPAVL